MPKTGLRAALIQKFAKRFAEKLGVNQHVRFHEAPEMLDLTSEILAANETLLRSFRGFSEGQPRSAVWFLPVVDGAYGGTKTIQRLATALETRYGLESRFAVLNFSIGRREAEIRALPGVAQFPAERTTIISSVEDLSKIRDADLGIASSWATAFGLVRFQRVRAKYYFLQDYEPGFHNVGVDWALAQETYRFGFRALFNSPGLAAKLGSYFRSSCTLKLPYDPAPQPDALKMKADPPTVVLYGRPSMARNGFLLASAALRKVKQRRPDVKIYSFGEEWEEESFGLVGIVKNLGFASAETVAKTLQEAQVGLSITLTPSPSLATLQMMDAGVAVVTIENAETDWLLENGRTCVKARPFPSLVADAICALIEDSPRRHEIASRAVTASAQCRFENAVEDTWRFFASSKPLPSA